MTGALEQQEAVARATTPIADPQHPIKDGQTSPAPSNGSSESEGKPVREKLKETRIDATGNPDPASDSELPLNEATNGSANQSASGSDSDRGRLRRKRSREDFEEEVEADKHTEKKAGVGERHARKRSRDITKDDLPPKPLPSTISRIEENDIEMTSPKKDLSSDPNADTSPKNKRTRDQIEEDANATVESSKEAEANGEPVEGAKEERDTKRLRDKDEINSTDAKGSTTKIPSSSGFANTSAASPFATMSQKPQSTTASGKAESVPQTSDDKFKASGFGSFASSAASPFSVTSPKPVASSPFGAASGSKLTSFAGSAAPSSITASGFGALSSSSTKSSFGGSTFGGSLGGGFGSLAGSKPGLSSFATPGTLEIKGLKSKSDTPFGATAENEDSDDEDGEDSGAEKDTTEEERHSSSAFSSQQPHETGEEGEVTVWVGRAKLYTMIGEGSARGWKERGTGPFKFNITSDEPRKARFVLRADGTHRLLLNAAVFKKMAFGGDAEGKKPHDGRVVFNEVTKDEKVEMHLLKLKAENAVKLWEEVTRVQKDDL
ncbi:hypothetical protein IQ07DRAFT_107569 [Pyrenochaeta sp. DS3sAY3a]|nr:hypothetical protein IQ07DRAFT_107569 [Pyrenochaeta sp. DS3sAY3a]